VDYPSITFHNSQSWRKLLRPLSPRMRLYSCWQKLQAENEAEFTHKKTGVGGLIPAATRPGNVRFKSCFTMPARGHRRPWCGFGVALGRLSVGFSVALCGSVWLFRL
jgi:hypothetical protein